MTNPSIAQRAATQEIAGQEVLLAYGDVAAEYDALRTGAIAIDRSHRGRMRFFGDTSGVALTGLVTNDVLSMQPGSGQYGAALSAKGRIVADLRIFAGLGWYIVDTSARAWPGFVAMVKKYVNPRTTGYRDDSHAVRDIGVFGADARRIVAEVAGVAAAALGEMPAYGHLGVAIDEAPVTVARVPDIGVEGYELFVPFEQYEALWERVVGLGATPAGLNAWDIARVEAGRPEWGIDIDDSTIPQEANFDDLEAISYTKGCYIGQELVARVHFRGHVNRHLRGLRALDAQAPPTGAQLFDGIGGHVGDVKSSVQSPRLGGLALGMVRREVAPGSTITARWEAGEQRVELSLLPFTD